MALKDTDPRVAKFLKNIDAVRDVFETVEDYARLSLAERGRAIDSVCRAAMEILSTRPDRERVLAYEDPLSPESEALWRSLIAKARREGWTWKTPPK